MGYSIIGSGSYLPPKIIANTDLETSLDTTDEWIRSRTGITMRHIAEEDMPTSYLAYQAALRCIDDAKIDKNEIDLIVVATTTPDNTFPSVANKVQGMLGLKDAASFDLQAVCSGFIYGLHIIRALMHSNSAKTVLFIGAEKMSSLVDWSDRATAVLFGDGAGAFIFQANETPNSAIIDSAIHSDGRLYDVLYTDGGPSINGSSGKIIMNGREVFKHAVEKMSDIITKLLVRNSLSQKDISYFVPHQANLRIIKAIAERIGFDENKIISTVDIHANCSAASIPLAFQHASAKGYFKEGDLILTSAAGAGFTWGGAIIRL